MVSKDRWSNDWWLHCNMGPSARNMWSLKPGGLAAVVSQDWFHSIKFDHALDSSKWIASSVY